MLFDNIIYLVILFVFSTLSLRRALQFFTSKVSSNHDFYQRLQRVTRFDSKALVIGGIPIAAVMGLLYLGQVFLSPRHEINTGITFFIFVLIGVLDDAFELRSLVKLVLQTLALAFWVSGPLMSGEGIILSLCVLVVSLGLTNSVNLLDGIDTLSTRLAQIGLIYFSLISLSFGLIFESAVSLFLISSLTIFSRYNRGLNPLYLGETGVNVISVSYLYLSYNIFKTVKIDHSLNLGIFLSLLPLVFYGTEILVSFTRRIADGRSPFAKDQLHLHHILTAQFGYSPYKSAYMIGILYFLSISIGASCRFLLDLNSYLSLACSLSFCLIVQGLIARDYWSVRPVSQGFGHLIFRRALHQPTHNVVHLNQFRTSENGDDEASQTSDKLAS